MSQRLSLGPKTGNDLRSVHAGLDDLSAVVEPI